MILKNGATYTRMFLMVLSSDHISGATGKTVTVKISKNGASGGSTTNSPSEVDSTNLPGVYSLVLSPTDTNTNGDLAYNATATGCDATTFIDQVQSQVFTDIPLQATTGRVLIANNLQQDTALNGFTFPMTSSSTGLLLPGLTVTSQRTLAGGGFSPTANSASEVGGAGASGIYTINLAAADLNSSTCGLLFTATNANTLFIPLIPTQ